MSFRDDWDSYPSRAAARRAAARHLHPDRGGDPARFVRALEQIDRRFPAARSADIASETAIVATRPRFARHAARLLARVRRPVRHGRRVRYITL
ncbi:hypothetical protein [Rhodococcus sp. SGAir0479]|uniref:hypothetical protein n=1 Tax=Rhodococcus sp. SGAir0479 TaxID=2567884 RepID=UPI0010CD61FD|nr:hypothetical protein [Rhodococcus sp. SGAir0479]QCQ93606.1 hypothetical protein E7742_21900 [Rhodococcus sp. SGAir0479]